jgi:hypothetical protein
MKKQNFIAQSISIWLITAIFAVTNNVIAIDSSGEQKITPFFGQLILAFEDEQIIIGSESSTDAVLSYVKDIKMNSRGSFFLLDSKQPGVLTFDSKGTFLRRLGNFGKGPGDFLNTWRLFIDYRDHIYVSDNGNYNVTELNPAGKAQHMARVNRPLNSEFFVSHRRDIFAFVRDMEKAGVVRRLVQFNSKGKRTETIAEFQDSGFLVIKGKEGGTVMGGILHQYSPNAYLYSLDKDSFCYGYNLEDRIYIYNITEKKNKSIPLPAAKELISSDEVKYFDKKYGNFAQLPTHRPFFKKLLCDEKGRIYVFRVNPILGDEKSRTIDVFNKEGNYIYQLQSSENPILIRHGYFYTLAEDESKDVIVKRFRIKNYKSMKF